MLYAIGTLCLALSVISARSPFHPLKWLTSFAWWGLLAYWINADLLTDGDPADVIVMLVIIMAAMLFLLWGMAGRRGTIDVEDEYSSTGSIIRRISKYTATKKEPSTSSQMSESTLDHRNRVRKALNRGKANRRKR